MVQNEKKECNVNMTKKEMEDLLIDKYGYSKEDLKNDRGNPLTNPVLEKMIKEEESKAKKVGPIGVKGESGPVGPIVEEEVVEEEESIFGLDETVFAPRHNLKDNDLVLCMSGVSGTLNFVSPLSGFRVTTSGFGQTMKIPYKDLVYVHNIATKAFDEGQIIVLNKAVQEEFGLTDIYKSVITPKNIKAVLNFEANKLTEFIEGMPKGMKATLYDEARKMYRSGEIDSVHTIRVLEDEFGVSFEDNAPADGKV